ncbi:MAG: calcium-binding protein [Beijerinckiaceae bacterium]
MQNILSLQRYLVALSGDIFVSASIPTVFRNYNLLPNVFSSADLGISARYKLIEQSSTQIKFIYSELNFRGGSTATVTITGENFYFTHYYAGYGFGYVPGTFLGGQVNSISMSEASGSGGPHGVSVGSSSLSTFSNFQASLVSLVSAGLELVFTDTTEGSLRSSSGFSSFYSSSSTVHSYLFGGLGINTLRGGASNDTIDGGAGADILDGGGGKNILSFTSSIVGIYAHLGLGVTSEGDTILNFSDIHGTWTNDTLAGDEADNSIYGFGGNDIIAGGAGKDTLSGGDGNDTIYAESGMDSLYGGDGFDILNLELLATGQTVLLGNAALPDGTIVNGFEGVIGSKFVDWIYGTDGINALSGGKGQDVITLGGGADYLNIAAEDIISGEFDFIADFSVGDSIYMPSAYPLYVYSYSGTTYAIANATGGGYWGMGFGGGASVATVQAAILYY